MASHAPCPLSAKIRCVVVTKINSDMLDIMLTWDQIRQLYRRRRRRGRRRNRLDDPNFTNPRLPSNPPGKYPGNVHAHGVRSVSVPGEKVIEQDADGDFFYIIKEGRCLVTRSTPANPNGVKLATLYGRR